MGVAVIDLGLDRAPPDIDALPRPVHRERARRAFGLIVTVMLLLGASAAPGPVGFGPLRVIPNETGDRITVLQDRVYIVGAGEPERVMSAYALPSADPLWTVPFRADGQVRHVFAAGNAVLVVMFQPHIGYGTLVAFDSRTGARLWRTDSWLADRVDAAHALVYRRSAAADASSVSARNMPTEVSGVDPFTGRVLWQQVIPPQARYERVIVGGEMHRSVLVPHGSGQAEVRDVRTGELLATGEIVPAKAALLDLRAIDHVLLARYALAGQPDYRLTAYDVDTLRLLWTVLAPAREFDPFACDRYICLRAQGGVVALDRASGGVRWRTDRAIWGYSRGRLLGWQQGGNLTVVDAATGRTVHELPGWWGLGPAGDVSGRWVIARPAQAVSSIWVGLLDVDDLSVRTVGSAAGVSRDTCRLGTGAVVCELLAGGAGVWQYRT